MRNIYFILLATILVACSKSSKIKSDWKKENLKGRVSIVKESSFDAEEKFGEVQKGRIRSKTLTRYNKSGFMSEVNNYYSDGSLSGKMLYKYDDKERLLEASQYDSGGDLEEKQVSTYNEDGLLDYLTVYNSTGKERYKIRFGYDENNYMNEMSFEFAGDTTERRMKQINNKKGLPVENENIEDGNPVSKDVFTYDKNNNRIEAIKYNADGSLKDKMTFKYPSYDKKGNWTILHEFIDGKPTIIREREIEYH